MELEVEYGGKSFVAMTPDQLTSQGVPRTVIDEAILKKENVENRNRIRSAITRDVGDIPSLLGTVSDASGILIALGLSRVAALASAKQADLSVVEKAELATIKAVAGDADIGKVAADALAQLQSGEVILTASLKGINGVIEDAFIRSTGVVNVLKASAGE